MNILVTRHAEEMCVLRGISHIWIEQTIQKPTIHQEGKAGAMIFLKRYGDRYLRVVAQVSDKTIIVITAHWIQKRRIKEDMQS